MGDFERHMAENIKLAESHGVPAGAFEPLRQAYASGGRAGVARLVLQLASKQPQAFPWFLHSLVNPPSDPLTIRLLALVEDLPSIPGPKTVGSENYSRIFDAFMKRGWALSWVPSTADSMLHATPYTTA